MTFPRFSLLAASLLLFVNTATQAEVIDMSKFTCNQLISGAQDAVEAAIWTSGYYNGLHKNTKLDLNEMKRNADTMVAACKEHPKMTVMQTVDTLLANKGKK